tara:strand:+ start:23 stop:631 length:609 start_codon:yes stop_codon:yes gene_type:complete
MDKTTAWLVRAASLIIILFGIGYISKPVGNKINDLSSSLKVFRSKPNLKGIACGLTKEDLNKSDRDLLNGKVSGMIIILFDKKNGENYRYDVKTNYVYNNLDYDLFVYNNDEERMHAVSYIKDSILYVDLVSFLKNGEEATREPFVKINLKTFDYYQIEYPNNSYSLLKTCRYIKIPKNIKLVEAEKFAKEKFSSTGSYYNF